MTAPPITGIDHVAVLVEDIEAALPYYTGELGFAVVSDDLVEAVAARLVMLELGDGRLQLVMPTGEGPLAEYLRTHGEGLHHIALKTGQIDAVVDRLAPNQPVRVVRGGQNRLGGFLPRRPNNVVLEVVEVDE